MFLSLKFTPEGCTFYQTQKYRSIIINSVRIKKQISYYTENYKTIDFMSLVFNTIVEK